MRITALLFVCLSALAGCHKPPPPVPVPVKGKVVFADGKPVKGMVLSFHPDDEATKLGRMPSVPLPDDGSFSVECLPGRYKATLGAIPKMVGGADAGPGIPPPPNAPSAKSSPPLALHADHRTTPLVVEVPASGTVDLVLTVK